MKSNVYNVNNCQFVTLICFAVRTLAFGARQMQACEDRISKEGFNSCPSTQYTF